MNFNDTKTIDNFNHRIGKQYDDFKIFLNMHYKSKRRDSDFWRYIAEKCINSETEKLLSLWQTEMPSLDHFDDYLSGLPHAQSQLYYPVVDGLGLLSKESAKSQMDKFDLKSYARKNYNELLVKFDDILSKSIDHSKFLNLRTTK